MDILKTGKRVYLRGPLMTDAAEFLSMVKDSRRLHRPWVYPPHDRKSFYSYVHWARSGLMVGTLICLRETDEIVGAANLSEIVRGVFLSAYLGFYGSIYHSGEGFVGEGVQLLIRHAFGQLKLHRVEANVQPANKKSLALVRRLGFRKEGFSPKYLKIGGRWRDHERWTLLADR